MSHHDLKHEIKELKKAMSQFLDDFRAALATVANGSADDQATKDAVKQLQDHLLANDASDEEMKTAIMELTNKLAVSTPPAEVPPAA